MNIYFVNTECMIYLLMFTNLFFYNFYIILLFIKEINIYKFFYTNIIK